MRQQPIIYVRIFHSSSNGKEGESLQQGAAHAESSCEHSVSMQQDVLYSSKHVSNVSQATGKDRASTRSVSTPAGIIVVAQATEKRKICLP